MHKSKHNVYIYIKREYLLYKYTTVCSPTNNM